MNGIFWPSRRRSVCTGNKIKLRGPLFLGIDTHALSEPAAVTTLEVFAGNEVEVMISENNEYTPTPAVSQAILTYNKGRKKDWQMES